MNKFKEKLKTLPKSLYVLLVLILALLIGGFCFNLWTEENITKIYSGLIVATVITILTVIFDFQNFKFTKLIYQSKLEDIFESRKEKEKYEPLILKAKNEISIMGVTASRFLEDLGKCNSKGELDKLLEKEVKIRILITTQKTDLDPNTDSLMKKYLKYNNFEVRSFNQKNHIPQSIFVVDDTCILGPILTGQESKNTAALQFSDKHSIYARQFISYFDLVWSHHKTNTITFNE